MNENRAYELLTSILSQVSKQDYPEICEYIESSIDREDRSLYDTPFEIACLLHRADSTKILPACAATYLVEVYEDETEAGNAEAANNLGALYYTGRAGERDYAKAMGYYQIAALCGDPDAQENLGYCYYYGRDTAVNYEKAFHYFALGAFEGRIRSLYKIGDMYRNGYYVNRSPVEAFRIYSRCAEEMKRSSDCSAAAEVWMRLADCYCEGLGTPTDPKLALRYYQRAERMFYDRLEEGDFLIKGCYETVIQRQQEIRKQLMADLPDFHWAE